MPNNSSAAVIELNDFEVIDDGDGYNKSAADKSGRQMIDAFIRSIDTSERKGLPAMIYAVEHLAQHKNSTPACVLMAKFLERNRGEERIFGGVIRAYFGEKVVTIKKDKDASFGVKFGGLDNFARGVAPRNTWGQVTEERINSKTGKPELLHVYNSRAFKEVLSKMFAKDKADPTAEEAMNKATAAAIKAAQGAAKAGVARQEAVKAFLAAYDNAL